MRVIQLPVQRLCIKESHSILRLKIMHVGESFNTRIKDYACRRVIQDLNQGF